MAETDYKATLHLPKTAFPMKASLPKQEPERLAKWEEEGLYARLLEHNAEGPRFLLHDGPPYANGHLHHGHMLNKVLKDIVVKHAAMTGHRAPYVPGWDCHGLPIELKVDKELGKKKREMAPADFRRACRAYAEKWVDIQRDEFKRLGVLGRWDDPYLTMDFGYEAQVVRELAKFAAGGGLYKGKKPVYWCIHDGTALAEAEVEYAEHTSPSIYVALKVTGGLDRLPEAVREKAPELVIWTTTPWTLPANLAIAVAEDFEYVAYDLSGRTVIVAKALLHAFLADVAPGELDLKDVAEVTGGAVEGPVAALAHPERILAHLTGADLVGVTYRHPFIDRESGVHAADHVTAEAGTGLVHTAPGHGQEDYQLGLAVGLDIYNPVDDHGRYVQDLPEEIAFLRGVRVWDANPKIVDLLVDKGALLSPRDLSVTHSYPHCWRCSNPVIFRATYQWFISMETNDLRAKALAEIDRVNWVPAWGKNRIRGMVENRPDWCISRQRAWGVPIPVLYCEDCGAPLADAGLMNKVADAFEEAGADVWFERSVEELVGEVTCPECGSHAMRKESDILDVWFDSGVSYAAVCEKDPELGTPVDVYLEGSDQHRGWFHSTLLCAVGTRGKAPYETAVTHGFILDEKGRKLSKKTQNFVPPEKFIAQRGAELLRLWIAAEDYRNDVAYSEQIVDRLADGYRKIRNTLRYALGNLAGFDPATDAVPAEKWTDLDRFAYGRLQRYLARVREAYESFQFHVVYHATMELCSVDLSSVYFDILKDRLYCDGEDWPERRAAQTVLFAVARDVTRALAPVLSFTSEEAFEHLREEHPSAGLADSVFLEGLPEPDAAFEAPDLTRLLELRQKVLSPLEEARREKRIGASLAAQVAITAQGADLALLQANEAFLPNLFIVSQVELAEGPFSVTIGNARGEKCVRCWTFSEQVGADPGHPGLCPRCTRAVA